MSVITEARPVIDRADAAVAVVEEVATRDAEHQQAAAAAVVRYWQSTPWPAGLLAQSLFVSTDGRALLTYAQWSSAQVTGNGERFTWLSAGIEPGTSRAYQLYRRVQPAVLPDPLPVAECFPAAVFAMGSAEEARQWVDGLLDSEEATDGDDRAYPGALAANFHVAVDGSGIFLLSEWVSEAEAVTHIKEVIDPLLEYMGQAEAGPGRRYSFYSTITAA